MTSLNSDLSRESSIKYDNREIQVTLGANQQISFKLKGLKSGIVSIGIEELYRQLIGDESVGFDHISSDVMEVDDVLVSQKATSAKLDKSTKDNPLISLNTLRTKMNTSPLKSDVRAQLDGFIVECINSAKKPFIEAELAEKQSKDRRK